MNKLKEKTKGVFIPVEVLENKDLKPVEKLLYSVVSYYSENGKGCFYSSSRLGEMLNVTEKTIDNAKRKLKQLGLLEVKKQGKFYVCFSTSIMQGKNYPDNIMQGKNYPTNNEKEIEDNREKITLGGGKKLPLEEGKNYPAINKEINKDVNKETLIKSDSNLKEEEPIEKKISLSNENNVQTTEPTAEQKQTSIGYKFFFGGESWGKNEKLLQIIAESDNPQQKLNEKWESFKNFLPSSTMTFPQALQTYNTFVYLNEQMESPQSDKEKEFSDIYTNFLNKRWEYYSGNRQQTPQRERNLIENRFFQEFKKYNPANIPDTLKTQITENTAMAKMPF